MVFDLVQRVIKDPTALSLLLANVITIFLALFFSWNLLELLWVYLAQSVIIGFFNFLKIIKISLSSQVTGGVRWVGLFMGFFFLIHYNGFHFCYFIFLTIITLFNFFGTESMDFLVFFPFLILTSIIFFLNHLFSFLYFSGSINKGEKSVTPKSFSDLMFRPYSRIIPMHLTIIFGGVFLFAGIFNVFVLLLFLVLKTYADVSMHLSEHRNDY